MKVFKVRWRWTTLEKKTFKLKWQVFCNISGSKKCLTTYLILFTESSGNINLPTYFQILYLVYNMEFFPTLLIQAEGYHFTIRPHRWKNLTWKFSQKDQPLLLNYLFEDLHEQLHHQEPCCCEDHIQIFGDENVLKEQKQLAECHSMTNFWEAAVDFPHQL